MYKIGLTGNRFSGKDKIASLFRMYSIPVFDADTVIKFILNYDYEVLHKIRELKGNSVFTKDGILSPMDLVNKNHFDDILDIIEEDILNSYEKFDKRESNAYSIFMSSILFERRWDKIMDYTINVFAPMSVRVDRAKNTIYKELKSDKPTKFETLELMTFLQREGDELNKSKVADFNIHNYGNTDIEKQVLNIDKELIDRYLKIIDG
jgi:dephospho-CoA kinase